MGRKRLLTILAGVVAAVGLHMGPATALDLEQDLGGTEVEASADEDGVEVEVGDDEDEVSAKVSTDDGAEAKAGDTEVSTKDAGESLEDPDDGPDETSSTRERPPSSGSDDGSTSSRSSSDDVATAGSAGSVEPRERPDALSPEEARRFLASSRGSADAGPRGDVSPAFDLSRLSAGDLDDPQVAAPGAPSGGSSESEWQAASPETAPPRSDAELAAIPAEAPNEVPAGLKLVAGLLVAGTGTLWHLTRRELQPVRA